MNREEIDWITRNLFVGNKLGPARGRGRRTRLFDLRDIRSPIVLFASMGDNITPPQQAFNWVADVYGSTDEIKANGQVIVGLLHEDVGHLGIFVSGDVAKKEHAQIVAVLEVHRVAAARPLRHGDPSRSRAKDGKVELRGRRSASIGSRTSLKRLNRFERNDEKAFEAVAAVSEFNQRAYELFAQPLVQAMSNETSAKLIARSSTRCASQRWAISDLNPWLAGSGRRPRRSRRSRQPVGDGPPAAAGAEAGVRGDQRVARPLPRRCATPLSEAAFFQRLRQRVLAHARGQRGDRRDAAGRPGRGERPDPFVREALASIEEGGFAEALARVGSLLARRGAPLPLARLALKRELAAEYRDLLPDWTPDEWRRIRGEQDIIVRYEPEKAIATLPTAAGEARRSRPPGGAGAQAARRRARPQRRTDARAGRDGRAPRRHARRRPGRKTQARAGEGAGTEARREAAHEAMTDEAPGEPRMKPAREKYQRLIDACQALPPTPTAVAHPCDETSLRGAVDAGTARPDRPDPGRPARADRGGREAARHRHRRTARSSTRRTATTRPRRPWSWCARARPRR